LSKTFAEPYAQFPQPQQSAAIIGGCAARNIPNIAYELGRLHLAPLEQFIGGDVQSYYEQGYNHQDCQYQPPAED
jgi:hypothetical protein